ncbi:MAG: hypothetical protein ABWZ99_01385 [Ilumatobacteraceae bacterium]
MFASDACIVEAVDEHDRPVAPGTPSASVLITNLFNHVQPLIRYRLDDRFVVEAGDGHVRARVEGRHADVLWFGGVEIHPLTIISELTHEPAIVDHRVVQTDHGVDIDVVTSEPIDAQVVASVIERALTGACVDAPRVAVRVVERLPINPATGKIARFVPLHGPPSPSENLRAASGLATNRELPGVRASTQDDVAAGVWVRSPCRRCRAFRRGSIVRC